MAPLITLLMQSPQWRAAIKRTGEDGIGGGQDMRATSDQDCSLRAIDQYVAEVRAIDRLAEGEEVRLLACFTAGGQMEAEWARTRLIEGYQPLVIAVAKRYTWRCEHLALDDLIQEGNVGLLEALVRYDVRSGAGSFRSWAFSWIRATILQAHWRGERHIRLPARKVRALRQVAAAQLNLLAPGQRWAGHNVRRTRNSRPSSLGLPLAQETTTKVRRRKTWSYSCQALSALTPVEKPESVMICPQLIRCPVRASTVATP